jgi:subtilisin family serine protease
MKKPTVLISVAFLILVSPLWAVASAEELKSSQARGPAYVPGELLIKYRPSMGAAAAGYYRTHWGVSNIRTFKSTGVQHVKLPEDMTVEEALEVFENDPDVVYAEPNYTLYATATFPNDPDFANLWGLNNGSDTDIDAPEAWEITTGSSDIVVAVIDSGVDYNHPDLEANIWVNPDEAIGDANGDGFPGIQGVDDDGDGLVDEDSYGRQQGDPGYTNDLKDDDDENGYNDDIRGWDFFDNDNDPIDSDDHGTHVAGTIAAVGNNAIGITGVCWRATIMALRFLDAFGDGTTDKAISAIEYANEKGAHIINNSWGGGGYSQALKEAIDASSALVVCAAGNTGTNIETAPFYPASFTTPHIISVAATDQNDNRASFSNYGITSVDVAAPGTSIYSCRPARQEVWSDDFEGAFSWSTGGTNNTWNTTNALSYSSPYSLTDSPGGDYQNDTGSWAVTPVLNLLSYAGTKLEFKLRGSSEPGFDFLHVQASPDSFNWTNQGIVIGDTVYGAISGTSSGNWLTASADLGAYDGNATVYIRFHFTSDESIVDDGWYIDDVTVIAASTTYDGTEYQPLQGTSMAAPHVSGIAGLIKAFNPSLSHTEIKLAIESSVDAKASLNGLVATAGRVNAYNAIIPCSAPSNLSAGAASAYQIDLGWTDNAHNEMGFRIERKESPTGVYSQIATAPPNAAGYTDTAVSPSTTYSYRIRAYNAAGNSGYSNEDDTTTPAALPPSDSGNSICFIAAAGHESFAADHFIRGAIPALALMLLCVANFGAGIGIRRKP